MTRTKKFKGEGVDEAFSMVRQEMQVPQRYLKRYHELKARIDEVEMGQILEIGGEPEPL